MVGPIKPTKQALAKDLRWLADKIDGDRDSMTGLPMRDALVRRLGKAAVSLGKPSGQYKTATMVYIDLDNFKIFNDTYGHEKGSELIKAFADRLDESVRPEDFVARIHGDEFFVLMPNILDRGDAYNLALELYYKLVGTYRIGRAYHDLSLSAGFYWQEGPLPSQIHPLEVLIDYADRAMFAAKQLPPTNAKLAPYIQDTWLQGKKRHLRRDLARRSIEQGDYEATYHPIYSLQNDQIVGAEMITRPSGDWETDSLEDDFDWLESIGRTVELWREQLIKACELVQQHGQLQDGEFRFYINIAASQLWSIRIVDQFVQILRSFQIEGSHFVFEISEKEALNNTEDVEYSITGLRRAGAQLVLDDFGSRSSNLDRLMSLSRLGILDGIKLDRKLTAEVCSNSAAKLVVGKVIEMANELGLVVTTEGVSSKEIAEAMAKLGCQQAQGYFYGYPLDEGQFAALLEQF